MSAAPVLAKNLGYFTVEQQMTSRVISDNKLYWCDGRLGYIASMNVDGSDRRTLISQLSADVHFMSLLLLHDELLVSDWANR